MYQSEITSVKFFVAGDKFNESQGVIEIISGTSDKVSSAIQTAQSIDDPLLGCVNGQLCKTCDKGKNECQGHFGYYTLKHPIIQPLYISHVTKWLKIVCWKCGELMLNKRSIDLMKNLLNRNRLQEAVVLSKKTEECPTCKWQKKTSIKIDPSSNVDIMADGSYVYPDEIRSILGRVTNKSVVLMGKDPSSHPSNFVISSIPIIPINTRNNIRQISEGITRQNDLSTWITTIIDQDRKLPKHINLEEDREHYRLLSGSYYSYTRLTGLNPKKRQIMHTYSSGSTSPSIAYNITGKEGHLRHDVLGKRTFMIARAVITGNPHVRISEVEVPLEFARTMYVKETVRPYNIDRLTTFLKNGTDKYPGAIHLEKSTDGVIFDLSKADVKNSITLNNGDIVYRNLIDGDPILFNRQPTLLFSGISCHYAKINRDPKVVSFQINVGTCVIYHADFDGDEMHLAVQTDPASRSEMELTSHVSNWMISYVNSAPFLGQTQDGVIGAYEMTKEGISLNLLQARRLFARSSQWPILTNDSYTGRQLISKLIPSDINLVKTPKSYVKNYAHFMNYHPNDIEVNIKNGELLRGVLDKKTIGEHASGGLYHYIYNKIGAKQTLETIFNHQQVFIEFLTMSGFSIGIHDIIVDDETMKEVKQTEQKNKEMAKVMTRKLDEGKITAPLDRSLEDFYEEVIVNALRDEYTMVRKSKKIRTNNLIKLVDSGSKGKWLSLLHITTSIGSILINDKRPPKIFGFKRTLPYFRRFDMSPEANGYINGSYLSGISTAEFMFNCMDSRLNLIKVALGTADSGYQERKSIKSLENIIISSHKMTVNESTIVQWAFGEDFMDTRKLTPIKIPYFSDSLDYLMKSCGYKLKTKDSVAQKEIDDMIKRIIDDRDFYRKIFMWIEKINFNQPMSGLLKLPVDVRRIYNEIVNRTGEIDEKEGEKDIVQKIQMVEILCQTLALLFFNSQIWERLINTNSIPNHVKFATLFMQMVIRLNLCPARLVKINSKQLISIIESIKINYRKGIIPHGLAIGIIAAQCLSEVTTQDSLDTKRGAAKAGDTKKGMARIKELLGVRSSSKTATKASIENKGGMSIIKKSKRASNVEESATSQMVLEILPDYVCEHNRIVNNIEALRLDNLIISGQIFVEKYGKPRHPDYVHEKEIIDKWESRSPLLRPQNLSNLCFRFELDLSEMINKNITMKEIMLTLIEKYPNSFIVRTSENDKNQIIRMYLQNSMIPDTKIHTIQKIYDIVADTILRGISYISSAIYKDTYRRSKIEKDGAIKSEKVGRVISIGSNIYESLLNNPEFDKNTAMTDNIHEIYRLFGIEAVRQRIIQELRVLVENLSIHHYMLYADIMTFVGVITSIERMGMTVRNYNQVLLRMANSHIMQVVPDACANSIHEKIDGVTPHLILGQTPRVGTLYSTVALDEEFIQENKSSAIDEFDEL